VAAAAAAAAAAVLIVVVMVVLLLKEEDEDDNDDVNSYCQYTSRNQLYKSISRDYYIKAALYYYKVAI
jgi:hypothetical protein